MTDTKIQSLTAIMRELMNEGATPAQLHRAIFNTCGEDARTTKAERERAREAHCHGSDNAIEVDDDAMASRADDGIRVQAWLWLANEELS